MRYLQNLHTHSSYCDGMDTPERMLLIAKEKGFQSIGFSGHSYMYYAPSHSMTMAGTQLYKQEIAYLKKQYGREMDIFCGLEVDMFSQIDLTGYDYLIGSVHYLQIGDQIVGFDRSAQIVQDIIKRFFNSDGLAYAKAYYKTLAQLPEYGNFDIIGHFDLITKHMEKEFLFDTTSKEYRWAAIEAAEALSGKIPCFEVNTGAISRGFRTTPYPDKFLLREMKRLGYGAVISSDCHDARKVDCYFPQARQLLRECGFEAEHVLTKSGFVPMELEK